MIQEVLKKIENSYYWDARVKSLDCNYFGDEVKLVFEDVEKEFDEVQKITGCSTGCGGCHDKIMNVISEIISG